MHKKLEVAGLAVDLIGSLDDARCLVVMVANEDEAPVVYERCLELGSGPFALAAIGGVDWDRDLSPWPAPPVFKRGDAFGGGADAFLGRVVGEVIPAVTEQLGHAPEHVIMAGYSLAGLFATYAATTCDAFDGLVSASGSLWFLGFVDHVRDHAPSERLACAYFSVGDREAKTKNAPMQTVEAATCEVSDLFAARGVNTTFELNPGGHFQDPDLRLGRGIAWVTGRLSS